MDQLPQALLFLGMIPGLFLLFLSIKGYEKIYKYQTVIFTFALGLILGFIAVIIEYFFQNVGPISIIILFPILEQLLKTIVLNLRRLQFKKETTVYGLSLGLGFGSIFIPFSLVVINAVGLIDNLSIISTVIWSLGIVLLHGATGAYIGYGVYIGKLWKYFFYSILIYLPVTILSTLSQTKYNYILFALVPYSIVIYSYVTRKIMPNILSDEKRKRSKK